MKECPIHLNNDDRLPTCWSWLMQDDRTEVWALTEVEVKVTCGDCLSYIQMLEDLRNGHIATVQLYDQNLPFLEYLIQMRRDEVNRPAELRGYRSNYHYRRPRSRD